MVLRAKNRRGIYCLLCKIGARKPTTCLLVSFAAQGLDVHGPLRVSVRAYKLLERRPRKGYHLIIVGKIILAYPTNCSIFPFLVCYTSESVIFPFFYVNLSR